MTDNIDKEINVNGDERRWPCYHEEFNASELVAAMAPVEAVLKAVASTETTAALVDLDDTEKDRPDDDEEYSLQEQDYFARIIKSQWESDYGPSIRYLAHLVKLYVKNVGEDSVQSEELLELLLTVMSHPSSRHNAVPNPCESCHVSFQIPRSSSASVNDSLSSLMRIRVYPQHNDVALRLWEAGAFLAEYLMEHPEHVAGKRVVELGAGVGATGLVVAGCCGAKHVCCTDYTETCLVNLRHNIDINETWLRENRKDQVTTGEQENSIISSSFLDWGVFDNGDEGKVVASPTTAEGATVNDELSILRLAEVLIAADVVYDQSALPSLVRTVRKFLSNNDSEPASGTKRTAIFASTRRNRATFDIFQKELQHHRIRLRLLASGEDCMNLPLLFPTKFNQPRSDGNIWVLLESD